MKIKSLIFLLLLGGCIYYFSASPQPPSSTAEQYTETKPSPHASPDEPLGADDAPEGSIKKVSVEDQVDDESEERVSHRSISAPRDLPRREASARSNALASPSTRGSRHGEITLDELADDLPPAEGDEPLVFSTDREGIKAAISETSEQVIECYQAWLKSNPSLEGRIIVSFSITPPQESDDQEASEAVALSQITEAELIVDDIAHPMMSGCILNSIEGLKFDAVDKPIKINYPFRFSSTKRAPK